MNLNNKNIPVCMNLYNVDLNANFFNTKLDYFYKNFFKVNVYSSNAVENAHAMGQQLLNCYIEKVAVIINNSAKSHIQIDIKKDLTDSEESKKLFQNLNFAKKFSINIEELNLIQREFWIRKHFKNMFFRYLEQQFDLAISVFLF